MELPINASLSANKYLAYGVVGLALVALLFYYKTSADAGAVVKSGIGDKAENLPTTARNVGQAGAAAVFGFLGETESGLFSLAGNAWDKVTGLWQ